MTLMDIQWEPWAYEGLVCPTSLGTLTQNTHKPESTTDDGNLLQRPVIL